ncbi:hypothetical protein MCOO_01290 [Mycobacterium cookii]|uniref:Uncharacterized protein n=1 Tax=Mycobacterium cookii TaxID=1775 RepID=A0A7I7KQS4_9MYCO|nr:hypothetical protein MCOO_01290 [Mycobacterium cookii]
MVDLRPAGDAGVFGDARRGRPGIAIGHQALDGGVEQTVAHGGAALRLRAPRPSFADFCHSLAFVLLTFRLECYLTPPGGER